MQIYEKCKKGVKAGRRGKSPQWLAEQFLENRMSTAPGPWFLRS